MADLKIGDEVYIHGFVDEVRRDTVIIKNKGGYFGTVTEEIIPSAQPEPKCANGCIYGWDSTECEHCALKSAQPEEVFEIGKPHPLKGYEFCIFKDAYGDDWVKISPWRGEEHEL